MVDVVDVTYHPDNMQLVVRQPDQKMGGKALAMLEAPKQELAAAKDKPDAHKALGNVFAEARSRASDGPSGRFGAAAQSPMPLMPAHGATDAKPAAGEPEPGRAEGRGRPPGAGKASGHQPFRDHHNLHGPRAPARISGGGEAHGGQPDGPAKGGRAESSAEKGMRLQREAMEAQMGAQFQMSQAQAQQDHESRMMIKEQEHQRAQRNMTEKMLDDVAADAMSQMKNAHDKLGNAASA